MASYRKNENNDFPTDASWARLYNGAVRRLIITADQLGVNPSRSHGIFQCMEEGAVKSA